jgi:hypothetical protein
METDLRRRHREAENDERHRARVERALRARPDIVVSNAEFVELLESHSPAGDVALPWELQE